jgi:hypothetical protein
LKDKIYLPKINNKWIDYSCLKTIKVFHKHAHFIIGILQKEKIHGEISNLHMPLCLITHPQTTNSKKHGKITNKTTQIQNNKDQQTFKINQSSF